MTILLFFQFLGGHQQKEIPVYNLPVNIVIVSPDGDTGSDEVTEQAIKTVQSGLDWWKALSPITITSTIRSVTVITSTEDYYKDTITQSYPWMTDTAITIFAINNTTSHHQICFPITDGEICVSGGFAFQPWGWFLMDSEDASSVAAHEFGHVLFNLDDLYHDDPACLEVDIMCEPAIAYATRMIGCRSLYTLGHPCQRIYLPMIATRGDL